MRCALDDARRDFCRASLGLAAVSGSAAVEGGGAQPQHVERRTDFEIFLRLLRIHVQRLVPVALTQPRSGRRVAISHCDCTHAVLLSAA
jgi:hypothetical protein